jgi:hypothetical protein
MVGGRRYRAVTLAEVLFAVIFTAFVVLAVVAVGIYAAKARAKSELYGQASWVATSLMNRCLDQVSTDIDSTVEVPSNTLVGPPLDPSGRFTYGVDEIFLHPPSSDDLKQVKLTVRWTDAQGAQQYTLSTKVSR